MKKLTIFFLFSLVALEALPQYVIDLSKFDYIDTRDNDIRGLVKEKGKYILYSDFNYIPEKDSITFETSSIENDSLDSSFLSVKDIPKYSRKDWDNLLEKSDIVFEEVTNEPDKLSFLVKKSPYMMVKITLSYDEYHNQDDTIIDNITIEGKTYNTLIYDDVYTINYIKQEGEKYVLLLIKEEDGDIIKIIPNEELRLSPFKIEAATSGRNFIVLNNYNDFLFIKTNDDKTYSLTDNYFKIPLGITGDAIFRVRVKNGPFAIYHKDSKNYDLYDPYLTKIEHNYNIRAIKALDEWLTLLVDNEILYFIADTIKDNLSFTRESYSVCGTYSLDTVENTIDKIILKKRMYYNNLESNVNYTIVDQSNIDSLYFFGNITTIKNASDYSNTVLENMLMSKKKNGKFNLYKYKEVEKKLIKEENKKLSLIERLNGACHKEYYEGSIQLTPLLNEDVDSIAFDKYPIIFKQDDIYGIYPMMKKAKYLQLEDKTDSGFIRYTKPDGEQGWLDMDSGIEYADI